MPKTKTPITIKGRLIGRPKEVFDFIVQYKIDNTGLSPTQREIVAGTDITSLSIVFYYLDILEDAKLIYRNPNISRGIQVVGGKWSLEKDEQ